MSIGHIDGDACNHQRLHVSEDTVMDTDFSSYYIYAKRKLQRYIANSAQSARILYSLDPLHIHAFSTLR